MPVCLSEGGLQYLACACELCVSAATHLSVRLHAFAARCYAPLAALLSLVFVLLLDDLRLRVKEQWSSRGKRRETGTEGDVRRTSRAVFWPLHDKVYEHLFHFVQKLVSHT